MYSCRWLIEPMFFLFLALLVRVWLVIHTNGVIDGDEALVGIQAQHILHSEWPVYFYGQPYMGSLEAYLVALLFAIAGSSVWVLRSEAILLSLLVVWLTWRLATVLADFAQLPSSVRRWFVGIATLFAAVPPLYDTVVELRMLGGYIEVFVLMLLLLLSALQLTRRWCAGATARELAWRWAGIGLVVGLGLWVNPLIISAILAAAIWIVGSSKDRGAKSRGDRKASLPATQAGHPLWGRGMRGMGTINRPLLYYGLAAISACLLGFSPALFWGASHQWQNVSYLLTAGENTYLRPEIHGWFPTRGAILTGLMTLYRTCVGPRVISGALPADDKLLLMFHRPTLVSGLLCIFTTAALVVLSIRWHHPLLLQVRRLAALPLLFAACTAFFFCGTTAAGPGLWSCSFDVAGRYATPIVLALPFFFATAVAVMISLAQSSEWLTRLPWPPQGALSRKLFLSRLTPTTGSPPGFSAITSPPERVQGGVATRCTSPTPLLPLQLAFPLVVQKGSRAEDWGTTTCSGYLSPRQGAPWGGHRGQERWSSEVWMGICWATQVLLLGLLLVSLCTQLYTYELADPGLTFQSPYCPSAPANVDLLINYLHREHIHYVWASNWIAYPLVFRTNGSIIAADPRPLINHQLAANRIPANTDVVIHADRPSMISMVRHDDPHPLLPWLLQRDHVIYRLARFPSEPGTDVIVVTPLSSTVLPLDMRFSATFVCNLGAYEKKDIPAWGAGMSSREYASR